ncbi:hypothetical protein ACFCZ6_16050 [Streptomyces hydrogenans]|uniref:hypothetical protein n=1 Tax=Streptomyces hydrogenans TaxID=1873719 RepID=UPI0035D8E5DF
MSSSPQDRGGNPGSTPASQDPPRTPPVPTAPPATPPSEASQRSRRSNGRLGEWAALISAVAAVAGVALGFLGLPALVKSPTARTETVYVTVTPSPTPRVTQTSASPSASITPSPSTTPSSGLADGGTTITLSPDYGFRLRGPAPAVERYDAETLDFYRDYDGIWAINGSRIVALKPEEPGTLAMCRSVTRFIGGFELVGLEAGTRFCFESGKGVLALVEAPKNGNPDDFLDLKIQFLGNR